ncbi:hypothetical protein ACHAXR_009018 [Thalassiosira sp. AJA248-18]
MIPLIPISFFTICWYLTSSVNSIYTQRLLRHIDGLLPQSEDNANDDRLSSSLLPGMITRAIWLTSSQLFLGIVISFLFLYFFSSMSMRGTVAEIQRIDIMTGVLHCFGILFTNAGFGYGSASLVQVVKLLEPIETLVIMAVHTVFSQRRDQIWDILPFRKVAATLIIVSGTSMLLVQKSMEPNPQSISFALASGFCMATRNVAKKRFTSTFTQQAQIQSSSIFQEAMQNGMKNFAQITIVAFVPAAAMMFSTLLLNRISISMLSTILFESPPTYLIMAVLFHCLYNMASITVLSLTSAPVHSLLNVGKRIATVLSAVVVFSTPLHTGGKVGILLAAVGATLYNGNAATVLVNSSRKRKLMVFIVFCLTTNLRNDYSDVRNDAAVHYSSKKFIVWMYPFPPPSVSSIDEVQANGVLICPYQTACQGRGISINLITLTEGSFYHPYILDHTYQKLRHFKDFCHHIQAITMISLLRREKGACVKTLGGTSEFCDPFSEYYNPFETYNPFAESDLIDKGISDLKVTDFPFRFLQNENEKEQPLSLAPDLNTEQFATYGPTSSAGYPVGQYNSGEDIQSMAGVGWYPFLSSVRNKHSALLNYTGYFIAGMLMSGTALAMPYANDSKERRSLMEKTELLSIFVGQPKLIDQNAKFLNEYTNNVYPFGCRSTLTCQHMKERQIKSYFSACITLTSMYEGSLLSGEESLRNSAANALQIVNPTSANYTNHVRNTRLKRDLILFVDVTDMSVIPNSVNPNSVRKLSANIPKNYPNAAVASSHLEKIRYCQRLLSQYKNYAKVVITSRIHVGLPAAAAGIPVIFVSKAGWLPGGHERVGRVAGLLDVFHRVDKVRGFEWTFGDLSGPMPPNPGNHYADRFRASFWHRFSRNPYYADHARLLGRIPLKRLGAEMTRSDIHHTFHFLMEPKDILHWQPRRAIENVFYFHPNAKVCIHIVTEGSDSFADSFSIFVESGYNLSIQRFIPKVLLEKVKGISLDKNSQDSAAQVGSLLWNHGGVFLSKSTFVTGELSLELNEGCVLNDDGSVAFMINGRESTRVLESLLGSKKKSRLKGNGKEWTSSILDSTQTQSCMQDKKWTLSSGEEKENDIAITFSATSLHEHTIRRDTACYDFVEKNCIYCGDLHWEY